MLRQSRDKYTFSQLRYERIYEADDVSKYSVMDMVVGNLSDVIGSRVLFCLAGVLIKETQAGDSRVVVKGQVVTNPGVPELPARP